jgi:hypothetical protein
MAETAWLRWRIPVSQALAMPPADQILPAFQIVTPERDRYVPDPRDSQPTREHSVFNKCSQLFESNRRSLPAQALVEIGVLVPKPRRH